MPREKLEKAGVSAIGKAGAGERPVGGVAGLGRSVERREEGEVLAGRQLGIEVHIVAEHVDARAQRGAAGGGIAIAVAHAAGRRPQQRAENREERGLAGAIRSEQTEHTAGARGEGDAGERLSAPEMARDVLDGDFVEVDRGPERSRRGWPERSRGGHAAALSGDRSSSP
jgi:hypothetical protein